MFNLDILAYWGIIGIILNMMENDLKPRSLAILRALVSRYIQDGQPVGSTTLARDSQLMVSSATIRTIMADLELQGYLASPHTSSGRVPTSQGYRLFIDHFVAVQEPAREHVETITRQLDPDCTGQLLAKRASSLLSGITRLTGIVTVPRIKKMTVRHIEFLPLSGCRVLVILVLNDHEVHNRVIHTQRAYSKSELEQAGNYISSLCLSEELSHVRLRLLNEIKQQHTQFQSMLSSVVEVAERVTEDETSPNFIVQGESHLFEAVSGEDIGSLKKLFDAFNQKRDLLHLLDQSMQAKDLKIFVGEESGCDMLGHYSVVTAPYLVDGNVVGVLGVVGPQRMEYNKVISTVDVTAKLLSHAFNLQHASGESI